ncbi:sol narae [Carabus blaptoides fortunei]
MILGVCESKKIVARPFGLLRNSGFYFGRNFTNTMAFSVLLLFSTWLLCSACANDVHKKMSVAELRSTFHVDSHELVPDYEIVHIHHISTRSIDSGGGGRKSGGRNSVNQSSSKDSLPLTSKSSVPSKISESQALLRDHKAELRLEAFGKPMNLSLVRTEGLIKKSGLKLWTVEPNATSQHGVEYVEIPIETHDDIGDIYQDQLNEAAILLRNDETNGQLLVEGSIGGDLVIRPIPTHLRQEPDLSDDEMYLDQEDAEEVAIDTGLPIRRVKKVATRLPQHIVYKKKAEHEDHMGDYAFMEPDHISKRYRTKRSADELLATRSKREAPYIIYPEILVIVDYDGYRLHGGDNVQIKRYFVSFWNGVDLRYKLLKGPKIRISIAGIIISRGRDATPYLERNRVGRDAIDSAAALTDMGKYLFRERRLPVYDIAVAITKYDMCRRRKGGRCTKGTAGFAYVGGACVVNKRLEKVNSVAIIEDTGGFSGIIVAAHEVGHLLGAVHDGSPPPSYLGGPGAEKCRWEDGYIMSDLRHTERGFRWSPCSVSSFHHFLNGETATCLFNPPHEDDSLPRVLPGKLLSLDAQCRKDRGTSACFKDDRVCAQLFCFDAGSGYCVAYRPAAEGSPCGDGQYCLNGRCVAEHENIIPDYSQNTPSYIRRQDDNQGRPLIAQ